MKSAFYKRLPSCSREGDGRGRAIAERWLEEVRASVGADERGLAERERQWRSSLEEARRAWGRVQGSGSADHETAASAWRWALEGDRLAQVCLGLARSPVAEVVSSVLSSLPRLSEVDARRLAEVCSVGVSAGDSAAHRALRAEAEVAWAQAVRERAEGWLRSGLEAEFRGVEGVALLEQAGCVVGIARGAHAVLLGESSPSLGWSEGEVRSVREALRGALHEDLRALDELVAEARARRVKRLLLVGAMAVGLAVLVGDYVAQEVERRAVAERAVEAPTPASPKPASRATKRTTRKRAPSRARSTSRSASKPAPRQARSSAPTKKSSGEVASLLRSLQTWQDSRSSSSLSAPSLSVAPSRSSNLPQKPGKSDIIKAMRRVNVARCASLDPSLKGKAIIDIRIVSSGAVQSTQAFPPFRNTPVGLCLEREVRKQRVPAFKDANIHFKFPFQINKRTAFSSAPSLSVAPSRSSNLPQKPGKIDIIKAMRRVNFARCASLDPSLKGKAIIDIRIVSSGAVQSAQAFPPFRNTPVGLCLEREVRKQRVPAFKDANIHFKFPFQINK